MEIFLEDQYLSTDAATLLSEIHAASSGASVFLGFRAARVPLPLGRVLARGGFGELRHPLRHEVLGLTYRSSTGEVEVGGTVVKNVAGYDLVRLLIGAGQDCFVRAHLRLRPLGEVAVYALASHSFGTERPVPYAKLREDGWDFAWTADATVYVQGSASLTPYPGAVRVERPPQATHWADAKGPLEHTPVPAALEQRIVQALALKP